jgi:hypothetical protein
MEVMIKYLIKVGLEDIVHICMDNANMVYKAINIIQVE